MSEDNWTGGRKVPEQNNENWERETLNKLALSAVTEQRRTRRWGIFFKLLMFGYLFLIFFVFMAEKKGETGLKLGDHTALVEIQGVIADNAQANADTIITGLRAAFKDDRTQGVIIRINSPGGSPVQAGYVNDEIGRLREEYPDIPLYAVIADVCASGGYYIAVAADEIYADKASIVGSIGVLMDGFGFVGAMEKLGVERRLMTSGTSKGFLDPFSPQKEEDVKHIKGMLGNIHQQFIDVVKKGRGDRLKYNDRLFSGLIWTGEQGIELGLVDALGSASHVAREVIGEEYIKDFTVRPDYFQRFTDRLGMAMANAFSSQLGLDGANLK